MRARVARIIGGVVASLLALAGVVAPAVAVAQDRSWEWHGSWHPMVFMWGVGGLVILAMILTFWALVITGLVVGLRWLMGQARPSRRDEAFEILRQRYARGEIDKQEFDTRRRDLGA